MLTDRQPACQFAVKQSQMQKKAICFKKNRRYVHWHENCVCSRGARWCLRSHSTRINVTASGASLLIFSFKNIRRRHVLPDLAHTAPSFIAIASLQMGLMRPCPIAGKGKIIRISTGLNPARFWLAHLIGNIVRFCIGDGGFFVRKAHFDLTRRIRRGLPAH